MRRRGPSYAGAFLFILALLAGGAALTFWLMRPGDSVRAASAAAPAPEVGDGFAVRDVDRIRPSADAYAPYENEGRRWRQAAIAGLRQAATLEFSGDAWRPSAEQQLDDSVYTLVLAGRRAEAASLLREWLRDHPRDAVRQVTTARLIAELGMPDEALERYRLALDAWPADRAVRMEYATALLWSGRHDEAAEAFRWLAESDAADEDARLGLARALAWGGKPAEAEPLLASLSASHPADTSLRSLLRSVRANLTPSASVAAGWLERDPGHRAYRLALARALALEGRHTDAALEYDRLLSDSASLALLSEAAGVRAGGGDSVGTAALLARAVAIAPDDDALRERYAQALAWSGDRSAASREYTRLLANGDVARLRLARGNLRLLLGDEAGAIADLKRAVALEPSYDALATLGDLYRWRGDLRQARDAYDAALAFQPGGERVLAGLALVRAAERASLAQRPETDAAGWNLTGSYAEDNAGFLLLRMRLARGFSLGRSTVAGVSAEQRRLSQRSATEPERFVAGYTVGAAVDHFVRGWQFSAGGGVARHALVDDIGYGHAAVSAPVGPMSLSLRAAMAPAYTELWSIWTLVRINDDAEMGAPLTMRSVAATAAMAVASARVEATVERMRLSDGNSRTNARITLSQPLTRSMRIIYSAGVMGYDGAGVMYWDPERYESHAVGVEYALPVTDRVTVSARAVGGVARATERFPLAAGFSPPRADWVPHFSGGIDASYRLPGVEITASGGYGRGAPRGAGEPGYQSLNGTLRVRAEFP